MTTIEGTAELVRPCTIQDIINDIVGIAEDEHLNVDSEVVFATKSRSAEFYLYTTAGRIGDKLCIYLDRGSNQ